MQIVDASTPEKPNFIRMTQNNRKEEITWNLRLYYRNSILDIAEVFEFINGYWASLPLARQDKIFECYAEARHHIDEVMDQNMMHHRLTQTCKKLYELMPFEEIEHWIHSSANIKVPPSIKDTYDQLEISERNQTAMDYQSKTYLRADYLQLINLAIALKPMIPIWAEYARADQVGVSGTFREYQALSLLHLSSILTVQPVNRLRTYIETNDPDQKTLMSAALGGLGSSELPDWAMALVIMRKLVIFKLSSYDDSNNIIRVIYHHVKNTINTVPRRFTSQIRDKPTPSGGDDDENKSILETYKIKQEVSDGDIMVLSIYTENVMNMSTCISPDIDPNVVELCIENVRRCQNNHPTRGQLVLLSWVLSRVIPPRSIDHLNKTAIFSCMASAQAVLWHWGFYDIALLLTATETRDKQGSLLGGVETRSRIPKEYVDQFVEIYPHFQEKGSKDSERQTNVACKAIDTIAKDFIKCDWKIQAPPELKENGTTIDDMSLMSTPSDIKTQLSALVLQLAKQQENDYAAV